MPWKTIFAALGATTLLVTAPGCTWLPVSGAPDVRPPTALAPITQPDLGPANGYVVGVARERLTASATRPAFERDQALLASLDAEASRITPAESLVVLGGSADLNNDGFLTLDEIITLSRSHVPAPEIARRITATHFVLAATSPQIDHLRNFGVSETALAPLKPGPRRETTGHKSSVNPCDW